VLKGTRFESMDAVKEKTTELMNKGTFTRVPQVDLRG